MFELAKDETQDISGGYYSIHYNLYAIVSNYGISDRCFPIIDDAFGLTMNQLITAEEAAQITYLTGCNSESMQYNMNVFNGLYYTIPA